MHGRWDTERYRPDILHRNRNNASSPSAALNLTQPDLIRDVNTDQVAVSDRCPGENAGITAAKSLQCHLGGHAGVWREQSGSAGGTCLCQNGHFKATWEILCLRLYLIDSGSKLVEYRHKQEQNF